jgi:hypothetical protein
MKLIKEVCYQNFYSLFDFLLNLHCLSGDITKTTSSKTKKEKMAYITRALKTGGLSNS